MTDRYDIADPGLAELGRKRIAWADTHMPVLASIRERFAKERPLDGVTSGIAFRGVAFRYRDDRPAIEHVELEIPVGRITAVVGPTGAGKSTLLALALRLFDPDRGRVEVDGLDLRRVQVASLRAQVAIALQENLLFGTTIRENIRYAVPDASDAAVEKCQ